MRDSALIDPTTNKWEANSSIFEQWIANRRSDLNPGLNPEPTIKVLIFLALLESNKAYTYSEIREVFLRKDIIKGHLPDITLRTSILSLGKTLDKYSHPLELKASRGEFQLIKREKRLLTTAQTRKKEPLLLLSEPPAFNAEDIACELIEKSRLPFHSLYFLERSARWWEIFSHNESQIRVQYECNAWETLGIKDRLLAKSNQIFSFVSLAPGEGLAEIELIKKILVENPSIKIHYLAVDTSQRLLREHINLLKESLSAEINNHQIICVGVIADIFSGITDTMKRVRHELVNNDLVQDEADFIPLLAAYWLPT